MNSIRIVGIRHRTKMTAEKEARPTQVVILDQGGARVASYDLPDEQAELDFLLGKFPISFRVPRGGECIAEMPDRHLKLKELEEGEEAPKNLIRVIGKSRFVAVKVANAFDGLRSGDTVAMTLGGSGDYFAFALARRGEEIGADVIRLPPFVLKQNRLGNGKEDDAELLARLASSEPDLFYGLRARDKEIILVREAFRARIDAMKERIACEQRLRQRFIGSIFCNAEGRFEEGHIEKLYDDRRANDIIYQALLREEGAREKELAKLVENSGVWEAVFKPIEGMGWAIASRIIAGVTDIRRFKSEAAFKAFCGVHVLPDGRFPRRRGGELANWHPDLRQALYLFGEQMNRRPKAAWGVKLREYKAKLRQKYPEPIVGENGKKKYTDGHIHKMASWKMLSKFAEFLYNEWTRYEGDGLAAKPVRKAA